MNSYSIIPSPLGDLLAISDGSALTALCFGSERAGSLQLQENRQDSILQRTEEWLGAYFRGENPEIIIPLSPSGTVFQRMVWDVLKRIPYGSAVSYSQISKTVATRMGVEKMSAQAVGGAVGRNPIPIIIPCHRVLGTSGSLTGFTGGLEKKIYLLDLEQIPYKK